MRFQKKMLLVAEAGDRVEIGSFHGGVDAEEKADGEGNDEAGERPENRDARGEVREKCGDAEAESDTDENPHHAAGAGERHSLEQKLRANVHAARADSLAHADFGGTLRDADQHDVHYADAANGESDRSDNEREQD